MLNNYMLEVAKGTRKADLVLKKGRIVNVFTEEIEINDIAICDGYIVGIGNYDGLTEIDCSNKYITPGFIDGHIHIESSMLKPIEFAKAIVPHGTTAVITDPHEIANVNGLIGIEYMMEASKGLPLDIYFVLPSCVPATSFDESGSNLYARDLEPLYKKENVVGLAEVMNYIGTINGDKDILDKIKDAKKYVKVVDGHGPGLKGKDIDAYVAAGVQSDHECSNLDEAMEKIKRGQWIMIREGTAAKNMDALMKLFEAPYYNRAMLVTDDKHPFDLLEYGHIDYIIRKAIKNGANPVTTIKMATFNAASYFGLKNTGALAPGYKADILILNDLETIEVETVFKNGKKVYDSQGLIPIEEPTIKEEQKNAVYHSFHCDKVKEDDFKIHMKEINRFTEDGFPVIELVKEEILTKEVRIPLSSLSWDELHQNKLLKLAVIERHHNTGNIGLGIVKGFGITKGAIASSVSHDSHNLIVIGSNDLDMMIAANKVIELGGGIVIALDGNIIGELPLPIAGLMSDLDTKSLADNIEHMKEMTKDLGVAEGIDPFMTLAFISLSVIPELRLTTKGLVDVRTQTLL